jgi:hypothetical protein
MALLVAHRQIFDHHFAMDPMVNRALGFHLRGYRHKDNWRIILALTPWMLTRLWFTETPSEIQIPDGWRSQQRADADYQLLGPSIALPEELGDGKAHINYHPALGHYLLQPIALNMEAYGSAQEAFEAWNQVTKTRDEALTQIEKACEWQQEISRRELYTKHLVRAETAPIAHPKTGL